MNSILFEPQVTHGYLKEYLDKVKYYNNINRKSLFIRYLNINKPASNYNIDTKGTFDHYTSGIAYDIYDYTPAFSFGSITNSSTDKTDMAGLVFDGLGDLVIYTITEPSLGDLITFAYGPSENTTEIFRVIQIDTSVYGKHYNINFCRLTLEYAPIKDISKLNIINNYVYLMTQEKNVFKDDYINVLKLAELNTQYLELIRTKFSEKYELYYYIINGNLIAPLGINKKIYDFLCYEAKLDRYFDKYRKPFGIKNYLQHLDKGLNINSNILLDIQSNNLPIIDIIDPSSNLDILSYMIVRP